jgi:hypothetical protein
MDSVLREAIAQRRLVSFVLDGRRRIGEPHDYGIKDGVPKLLFYQTAGESSSGQPLGWRTALLSKMSDVKLLDERFPGPRPAPSGRHVSWDSLYASVSSRKTKRTTAS